MADDIKKPLSSWLDDYHEATGTISGIVRNLAFALIGIAWIFRNSSLKTEILPVELIMPITLVAIALGFDLLQYLWYAISIRIFYGLKESWHEKAPMLNPVDDIKLPTFIEVITWIFFVMKIILTITAYYFLYKYLLPKI